MSVKSVFFLFFAIITIYEVVGVCQNVPVVQNFNIPQYSGLWYEIHRYEQPFELDMHCVTANYTVMQDGTVRVENKGIVKNQVKEIIGTATSNSTEGKLLVTFPGNVSASNYWVLDTNYKSYSVVYSCRAGANNVNILSSWVLSRTPYMLMNDTAKVIDVINRSQDMSGLSWDKYIRTIQEGDTCKSSASTYYSSLFMIILYSIIRSFV